MVQQAIETLDEVTERLKRRLNEVKARVRQQAEQQKPVGLMRSKEFEHTDEERLLLLTNMTGDLTVISRDLLYPDATVSEFFGCF